MNTIDFSQTKLHKLITHFVGNKSQESGYALSKEETTIKGETNGLLLQYFLEKLKKEEIYSFDHAVNLDLNEVYNVVSTLFKSQETFIESSKNLVKLLYESSSHPKVKEGNVNVTLFSGLLIEDEIVDAVGIFKSEQDVPFIKMKESSNNFDISHENGFELTGLDKGCLILNTHEFDGYKVIIVDNANRFGEAQYWKDSFLQLKPVKDEYHQTNQFLGLTKKFVTKELSEEFGVTKADKIDLLNKSVEYFKSNESFSKEEFIEEIFDDSEMKNNFKQFNDTYTSENNLEIANHFDISSQAVKKQARVFKSVLKLDKNFHIYIHGNKELIERGVDDLGRKYYKIYYTEER